uniref:Uncharacterized protein n=1 Tax=Pelusios castaneus TaxID=367368 RepID=A0A8C8R4X0_9SAUR
MFFPLIRPQILIHLILALHRTGFKGAGVGWVVLGTSLDICEGKGSSPIGCHLYPLLVHSSPLGCHLYPLLVHSSPLGCHLYPLLVHSSPIGCHLYPLLVLKEICHFYLLIYSVNKYRFQILPSVTGIICASKSQNGLQMKLKRFLKV